MAWGGESEAEHPEPHEILKLLVLWDLTKQPDPQHRDIMQVPMRRITDFIPGDPTRRGTDYPGPLPRTMTTRRNLISLLTRLEEEGKDPLGSHYICDLASMTPRAVLGRSPCLTRTRCTTGGHWLTWRQRWMHLREMCLLQGLDSELLRRDRVSQREIAMMAGNAIPIPLLARVLQGVLDASY